MLETIVPVAAVAVAVFMGMFAADKFVAFTQRPRFSLRGLLIFTFFVSVALTIAVAVARK
jgi:hypothetical protein